MTKNFDELNETFDVAGDIVSAEPVKDTPKPIPTWRLLRMMSRRIMNI